MGHSSRVRGGYRMPMALDLFAAMTFIRRLLFEAATALERQLIAVA